MIAHCLRSSEYVNGIIKNGGGGGIRTPVTLAGETVFETAAFNHSATPPRVLSGGEMGIRTPDALLAHTRFPIVLLRPTRTSLPIEAIERYSNIEV